MGCQYGGEMASQVSLESYSLDFSFVLSTYSSCGGEWREIRFWEDLRLGDQLLCVQYSYLYRVTPVRNLATSMVLGFSSPSTWNLNFRRNLYDIKFENLKRLLISIGSVQLFHSTTNSRGCSLSSTSLFTVKSLYLALSMTPSITLFHLAKFLWNSKAPPKAKVFALLVAHRKVNTNDPL